MNNQNLTGWPHPCLLSPRDMHRRVLKARKAKPLGRNAASRVRRAQAQLEFDAYKLSHGCSICGYAKCAASLDFHHPDESAKESAVRAITWKTGKGAKEFLKCILVCANCHRELHWLARAPLRQKNGRVDHARTENGRTH